MTEGRFITFEGGEGAGKSTQVARLAAALRDLGKEVLTTREPGGAAGAEEIRDLLVRGDVARWDSISESLLHSAARRAHLAETVWPALDRGTWVISDRFADSTMAYQGYGHCVEPAILERLYDTVAGTFQPDLTLILDLPVDVGLARAAGHDEDRYERMETAFHERVRAGFLAIAAGDSDRCIVIDGNRSPDLVASEIWDSVAARLGLTAS